MNEFMTTGSKVPDLVPALGCTGMSAFDPPGDHTGYSIYVTGWEKPWRKKEKLRISILKRIALLFTLSLIVSSLLIVVIQYIFTLNEIREEGTIAAEAIGSTVKTA